MKGEFPHTVTVTFTDRQVFEFCQHDVFLSYKMFNPAREWCDAKVTGAWSCDPLSYEGMVSGVFDETGRLIFGSASLTTRVFRFERQEDAALFKLFWS